LDEDVRVNEFIQSNDFDGALFYLECGEECFYRLQEKYGLYEG